MGKEYLKILFWNKGPSRLINKIQEVEVLANNHLPHILGLAEANLKQEDNETQYQLQGYKTEKGPLIKTGTARVVIYI